MLPLLSAGLCPSFLVAEEIAKPTASASSVDVHRTYLEQLRADEKYPSAATCAQCHPDHYREWSVSAHAYGMMSPVFNAMHMFTTEQLAGTQGDFCLRCHSPVASQREEPSFSSVLVRPEVSAEGVTCIVCHRLQSDFGLTSGRPTLDEGDIFEVIKGPTGSDNLKEALANTKLNLVTTESETGVRVHGDIEVFEHLRESSLCGSCHDVNAPNGFRLESAFTQFKNSPASKAGQSCQDCHMGVTPGKVLPDEERAGPGGRDLNYAWAPAAKVKISARDEEGVATPARRRTNHMFVGPDYSIVHPGLFPHSLEARELTYRFRFSATAAEELADYIKNLNVETPTAEQREEARSHAFKLAEASAEKHAKTDWLNYRYWEGWGLPSFENQDVDKRQSRLSGVGEPWNDPEEPALAQLRRQEARIVLSRQFNLLNEAHVERVRLLRRGYQLEKLEFQKNQPNNLAFRVLVTNPSLGHGTPTGFDAERLVFLEVTMTDAQGRTIFQSGTRDPNGDVLDLHSAYVHAHAPKEGPWLAETDWKDSLGMKRLSKDRFWEPDAHLFTLQTKFITRNAFGGEREQVVAVNRSVDPLPFMRPENFPPSLTGNPAGARKHSRVLPPDGERWADYKVGRQELTPERPYRIRVRMIAQMVPVNLVKTISPVGFDFNLSAAEVARRVAYGHPTTPGKEQSRRRGGAVELWDYTVNVPELGAESVVMFSPQEKDILSVPVSDYPFPHTTEEQQKELLQAMNKVRAGNGLEDLEFSPEGHILWPDGVPSGIPLLPPSEKEEEDTNP